MDDKVKVLTEQEALDALRKVPVRGHQGVLRVLALERSRTQRALTRWDAAGLTAMEARPGGRKIIRIAVLVALPNVRAPACAA
jgi:hypothetical protein